MQRKVVHKSSTAQSGKNGKKTFVHINFYFIDMFKLTQKEFICCAGILKDLTERDKNIEKKTISKDEGN